MTRALLLMLPVALLGAAPAAACPLCGTETAEQIRSELVDEHLAVSVAAVATPLAALGLLLAGVAAAGRIRGPEAG